MEFNLNKAIQEIKDKYDNRLLSNPINLQKVIEFEYKITMPLEELEKLYQREEDYELESRKIDYGY
jgi:hypothetical protein